VGRLYKRGRTWWGDYRTASNIRVRESLKTADREVARTRLRDAELGLGSGQPEATAAKALAVAIDEMMATKRSVTAESYRHHSTNLLLILGYDRDINSLGRADIVAYVNARLEAGIKRHTIQKELVVLRQALKEARTRGSYDGSLEIVPAFKPEYEPKRRWLTVEEFNRLLAAVHPYRRTWLMIQVYTGAELSAMRRLAWSHVDLVNEVIQVPGTKNSARYRAAVPLHPALKKHLRGLNQDEPLLLPWPQVHADLRAACDRAGIRPRATTHDLRRTFGSWLVQAGVDILHVARLMGNSPTMVAKVYGQTTDKAYADAIKKLPRLSQMRHKS
jgi:integrase